MNLEELIKDIKELDFKQIEGHLSFYRKDVFHFKETTIRIYPEFKEVCFLGKLYLNGREYRIKTSYSFYELELSLEHLRMDIKNFVLFVFKGLSKDLLHDIM